MPKKRVKKESENKVKEKTIKKRSINKAINSSTNSSISESKRIVGRPRKTSTDTSLTNESVLKKKRNLNSTQSQIVFTHKEKKAFYECLVENGLSAIHNEKLLMETLPNRSSNEIKSLIESYSRKGRELNKRTEESVESESNSDKQPIDEWFDLIHQTVPNAFKKDDMSVIFAEIFEELAQNWDSKSMSNAGHSSPQMSPNYGQIYHYLSETLRAKFPPELEAIDSFVVLKLIEELKEIFKSDDYENEREYLSSAKWWQQNGLKPNFDYYSAIHLQRQRENPNSVNSDSHDSQESSTNEGQTNDSSDKQTNARNPRSRSSRSNALKLESRIEGHENGETSSHNIEESEGQNVESLQNFPKLRKIADCFNPIKVPINLTEEEYFRWQK